VALNLVEDDQEWVKCFDEAVLFSSGHGLRSLFVTALMYGGVLHPKDLWIQFCGYICDDIQHKLDRLFPNREYMPDATESESDTSDQTFYENSPVLDYGLYLIQVELENLNKSLSAFRMPFNKFDWAQRIDQQHADDAISSNAFLRMEQSHDVDAEESLYIERYSSFNDDQKAALDTIVSAVEDGEPQNFCFFLQGPAGTGKTFIYNTLCNYFRSKQMIVACVASSGIASLLLPNGRTSHFLFKIPLLIASDSTCSIRKNSELAEYLRKTDLIIWDEVPMQNKHCFEAVDRALKDIKSCDKLFGGVPVVLGGDFAQIPPVVRNGDRPQIVDASIRNSYIWSKCQVLRLSKNMRVQGSHFNDELYKAWLSQLPYNPYYQNNNVSIPAYIYRTNELDELIERVYPADQLSNPDTYPALFGSSSILASQNITVDDINKLILNRMPGEQHTLFSVDRADVSNSDDTDASNELFQVTTEYLQSLNPPNFPRSKLQLKIGSVVMLLRNLNVQAGLCNGTRMLVREVGAYTLQVSIINSANPDDINIIHCIPRITLSTLEGELSFTLTRKQFPVRLCFAMTINKSQGQSLSRVGIDLRYPTFTHGQLYVAFSRSKDWQNVSVLFSQDNRTQKTENIVYPELLL
jgi:hypothetical protein